MELFVNFRQTLASLVLASVAVFGVANAGVEDFTDAAEIPSWAEEAIEELMDQGVLSGNDDGSFAPNRQLNRAEVSKIIVLATGIDFDMTGGPHFPDVAESAWYYNYIETMYNEGWINGYPDGFFRPGVGINRAEMAKMVVNAFEIDTDLSGAPHFSDVNESDWFYGYVETAYNNGCMRGYGDGTFGPGNAVTRAETARIVFDCQLVVIGPGVVPTAGTLEVALSYDTPRGTNIPFNATSVPFTTVELTASDDSDVEVASMTFTRLGLGDNDDFDNVWLEIDGFKVGNDKSVNNDDVVELRFNPPIVIPAGQTIVADVVASMEYTEGTDENTGHHNRFALVSPEDVVASAQNIVGNFPIEGEEMEIASYEVSELAFSRLGSNTTVEVGDNFVEIGKYRLLNESNSNKDIELRAITFKNDGTAELEDNLENVALYVSGEQVSAETIMDGDYITFRLDNGITGGYIVEDGDSKIFSIRGDIVSAEKGDFVAFKIDNFEDVVGVEIGTAFGVRTTSDDSNGATLGNSSNGDAEVTVATGVSCSGEDAEDQCARLFAYNIDAGDLNISRDPSSLGNQEYAPGSNDVVFLTARLVAGQPIIVDGVQINVASTTSNIDTVAKLNEYFDNFRVYYNDTLIDSVNDFEGTTVAGAVLDFNTSFEIAGTGILKVIGNIEDEAPTGSDIRLQLNSTGFDSPEYISTGDQVDSNEIVGNALASFVEVERSVLTITKSDGFSDFDQIVAGVDDVTMLEFVLDNNDSGDVNVTNIQLQAYGTGNAATYNNFTAAIFVDGVQQGSARNLESDGEVSFNDISVVIPSASQKEFEVVVDTLESAADLNPANTTLASGGDVVSVSGTVLGTAYGTTNCAVNGDIIPSNASSLCVQGDVSSSVESGDLIIVSDDGLPTGGNAETKTVDSVTVAGGFTTITVTTPFVNEHGTAGAAETYTSTITVPENAAAANDLALNIDGAAITLTEGATANDVAAAVAAATFTNVTASATAADVTFTSTAAGTAGNVAVTIADDAYSTGTFPAVTLAGGVDEVVATATVTVGTVPATTETTTVGQCVITFNEGAGAGADNSAYASQDVDCSDNAAEIGLVTAANPGVALTAAEVSAIIDTLTGVTDAAQGALVVSAGGASDTVFTAPAAVAGDITFASTAAGVTNVAVTGVEEVKATATVTVPAAVDAAHDYAITVGGVNVTVAAGATKEAIAAQIAGLLGGTDNGDGTVTLSTSNAAFDGTTPSISDANYSGDTTDPAEITVTAYASAGAAPAMYQKVGTVVQQYPVGATTIALNSVANIQKDDVLTIGTNSCTVASVNVSAGTVTCTSGLTAVANVEGTTVTESTSNSTIRFAVKDVDADNVENGQEVAVQEASIDLGDGKADASGNGDCNDQNTTTAGVQTPGTSNNYLCGVQFNLAKSGTLTISEGATIVNSSNILVANATDVEILKVRLSAANDEVVITDMYFKNTGDADFGERVTFKLYDESGALLATEQMQGTALQFEMGNTGIRVPKDSTTSVTVKVDVKDITQANQSGLDLVLELDTAQEENGVEATTSATGSDLEKTSVSASSVDSEGYVAYRTMLTFANAGTQPTYQPSAAGTDKAIYRFTVSNDEAYEAVLNEVTLNVGLSSTGIYTLGNTSEFTLVEYSSAAYSGTPTTVATATAGGALTAVEFKGFSEEIDGTGYYEVRTTGLVADTGSDNDSFNVSFVRDASQITNRNGATSTSTANNSADISAANTVWSDRSANGAEGAWHNGFELIFPSNADGASE